MIQYRSHRNVIGAAVLLMALLMLGCQTTPTNGGGEEPSALKIAYSTLKTAGISYDTTMRALADLDAQGKLTAEQKVLIIDYGDKFWLAYHTALEALVAYKRSDQPYAAPLEKALSALSAALAGFLEFATTTVGGK